MASYMFESTLREKDICVFSGTSLKDVLFPLPYDDTKPVIDCVFSGTCLTDLFSKVPYDDTLSMRDAFLVHKQSKYSTLMCHLQMT